MARSSGDTLSLKNLGTALSNTASGSGISLNTLNGGGSTQISIDDFAIDAVGAVSGFTYLVENTSENYDLGFSNPGSKFDSDVKTNTNNFTWSFPVGSKLSVSTDSGYRQSISAGEMTNAATQTVLQTIETHTVRAKFHDGFNDHATNYNSNRDKTVYSVDSYDNNATALCLTADSPITKYDGTIVEVGDLEEGDELLAYNPTNLNLDSDDDFFEWNSHDVSGSYEKVTVKDMIFSFASTYYDINSGSITATSEHPMLVWDNADHIYRFKEIFRLSIGDKLIRQDGDGIIEVPITTIDKVTESTEIVSINVEDVDTYLVNGYVTHNKGGNSHTDITAPTKVLGLSYSSPNLSWTEYTDATAYDVQVDNNSDFSSPGVNETEWNTNSIDDLVAFVDGTYSVGASLNARVRAIKSGLAGAWSDTLSFTL